MSTIGDRWQNLWERIQQSPARLPARVAISREHVDGGAALGGPFQRDAHYFQVRINEMFLSHSREWFARYDPLVLVVSEFTYDKRVETVPFVIGPALLERYGEQIPTGMIFANTRVAGLHPFRGGRISLSVVLCRVQRDNYPRQVLRLVESISSALDFSTALAAYAKIGDVVLDGVEALLGLGQTDPLIGVRNEYDRDAGDPVEPSYFALLGAGEDAIDPQELWVRDNRLLYGSSLAAATPFRRSDYVLYSLAHTDERSDETTLPFYPLYEHVVEAATRPDEDSWKRAKANMLTLYQALALSPDLTPGQASALSERYVGQMKQLHEQATNLGSLGPPRDQAAQTETDATLREAVGILDL